MFADYTAAGWSLVPLSPETKRPRYKKWNRRENVVTDLERADRLQAAGLAHAYSGTCTVDVDDLERAREALGECGIDLDTLLEAEDRVAIDSGREGRAKLLYALDEPIPSVTLFKGAMELRSASRGGRTYQDALPPTVHPDTGRPYQWSLGMVADWADPPPLPDAIRQLWWASQPAEGEEPDDQQPVEYDSGELETVVGRLDPDSEYPQWVSIGMALHDATGGDRDGFEIWDQWSRQGDKYPGRAELLDHWRSFQRGGGIDAEYLEQFRVAEDEDFSDDREFDPFEPVPISRWARRPPPKWIIDQVLPKSDLAMIYGAPSAGKTFFAMDMAFMLATGQSWWGRETEALPVAWIAAEAPGSVRNRSLAMGRYHELGLDTANLWVIGHTPNFQKPDEIKQLAAASSKIDAKVIFVDTLSAVAGGANENSGEDMSVILAACRALHRATDALVVLIHHSGKDASKGARGWSGVKAAVDTEIEVAQIDGGPRVAKIVKQRDGVAGVEYPFRLTPVELEPYDGQSQHSCAVEPIEVATMFTATEQPGWPHIASLASLVSDIGSTEHVCETMDRMELAGGEEIDSHHSLNRLFETGLISEIDGYVEVSA